MSDNQINWMLEQIKAGKLDRREFVGRAGALGIGAAAATTMMSSAGIAAEPMQGGEVSVAGEYSGSEETFDPTKMTNGTDVQRAYQVYNRLTNLDRDMQVVPNLATEWEATDQASVWTFKLREGVEFHDGKTMTAEDVIYSFSEHIKEGSESPSKPLLAPIIDMEADGPNVIKFTLDSGNADFPTTLGHDYHTSIVTTGWKDGDPVNGTGAYKLTEFEPGLISVTEKNANYWNESAGHVNAFITQGIPDNAARSSALRSGSVDIDPSVEPRIASLLDQDPGVNVVSTPSGSWMAWVFATDRAPSDDNNVRMALKLAVDRQNIVDNVLLGHGKVGNDFPVNPGLPTYSNDIPQHAYDPEKAKWYWDKTGLSSIELAVSNAGHTNAVDASIMLQENARAAGIEINLNRVPDDGYWSHTWMQVPFCVTGWNSRPTADAILTIALACGGSWNETFWCSERFDELLVMGRLETDLAKRQEIYHEACLILHDEGGVFLPFFSNYIEATTARIQNYHGSPAFSMGAGWPYEEIWIDESQA
ncbi:MAG: ABC transporter substrate-binding protein [Rhodospirillaceae bacterium]|jgi:peptide/nickel transport system substrate-binding protein|nr:ABC transporter substrate-binding protein [Rhodospirillaceae bacterium]MBT7647029.1 ABC transporter substrate-binding protein [Rhodospirillaceae bacterium]